MTWAYAHQHRRGATCRPCGRPTTRRFTARTEGEGHDAYIDDPGGYGNDAFPNVPWGINNDPCNAAHVGLRPQGDVGAVDRLRRHATGSRSTPSGCRPSAPRSPTAASASTSPPRRARWVRSSRHRRSPIVCPSATHRPGRSGRPRRVRRRGDRQGVPDLADAGEPERLPPALLLPAAELRGHRVRLGLDQPRAPRELRRRRWEGTTIENPSMTYINGAYVLLYSGNDWNRPRTTPPGTPCARDRSVRARGHRRQPAHALGHREPGDPAVPTAWPTSGAGSSRCTTPGTRSTRRRAPACPHVAELKVTGTGLNARVTRASAATSTAASAATRSGRTAPGSAYDQTPASVGGTYVPAAGDFNGDGHDDIYWYGTWADADAHVARHRHPGHVRRRRRLAGRARSSRSPATSTATAATTSTGTSPAATRSWPSSSQRQQPRAQRPPRPALAGQAGRRLDRRATCRWPSAADPAARRLRRRRRHRHHLVPARRRPRLPVALRQRRRRRRARLSIVGNYRPDRRRPRRQRHRRPVLVRPRRQGRLHLVVRRTAAAYTSVPTTVTKKDYRPFAADVDGDGADELFWYTPGTGPDYIWTDDLAARAPPPAPRRPPAAPPPPSSATTTPTATTTSSGTPRPSAYEYQCPAPVRSASREPRRAPFSSPRLRR